jgi:hypothetical protein
MDEAKILLCRLSKGRVCGDVSSILGSLIVSKMSLAALERESVPEYKRRPHMLIERADRRTDPAINYCAQGPPQDHKAIAWKPTRKANDHVEESFVLDPEACKPNVPGKSKRCRW